MLVSESRASLAMSKKDIYYSDKYTDDKFEYRHVMLPKDLAKLVPKTHLMTEAEWRNLGVQQSLGKTETSSLFISLEIIYNSHQDGSTTCYTSRSPTSCSSGGLSPSRWWKNGRIWLLIYCSEVQSVGPYCISVMMIISATNITHTTDNRNDDHFR